MSNRRTIAIDLENLTANSINLLLAQLRTVNANPGDEDSQSRIAQARKIVTQWLINQDTQTKKKGKEQK